MPRVERERDGRGRAPHPSSRPALRAGQGRPPEGQRDRHPVRRARVHALSRGADRFHQHARHRLHPVGGDRRGPRPRSSAGAGDHRGQGLRDRRHPRGLRHRPRGGCAATLRGQLVTMARTVDDKMPFLEHLGELRVRIMRALIALLIGTVIGLPFSQYLIDWLARPVTKLGYELVFTAPAEAFWVQMKVGIIAGLFVAAPAILWQVWGFVAPGLHTHEKKYAAPFVIVGSVLFLVGGAFSLFVVTPYALTFLLSYARPGLKPMITLENHIDFLLKFTLAFGAVFELPLLITLASRMGLVTAKVLAKNRKYAILGAFVIGAVLTPTPDAFNQALMAGPLIILYEVRSEERR